LQGLRLSRTDQGAAAGSCNRARNPPRGLSSRLSEPPYISAVSLTMDKPKPVPGVVSSWRCPRFSADSRCSGGIPGPSSSTTSSIWPLIRFPVTQTRDTHHLPAFSMRLPTRSSRSCRSPLKTTSSSISNFTASPLSRLRRSIVRARSSAAGPTTVRVPRISALAAVCARLR